MIIRRVLVFSFLLGVAGLAAAQVQPPYIPPAAPAEASVAPAPPLRLAEGMSAAPLLSLSTAELGAPDQLAALTRWNVEGNLPVRTGFVRPLPSSQKVVLTAARPSSPTRLAGGYIAESFAGTLVWGTSVRVAGAYRLRLRLTGVDVPAGTRFWVYGLGEQPRSFGLELLGPDGSLWTPSIEGEMAFLEAELPKGAPAGKEARFTVREVSQSFRVDREGRPLLSPDPSPIGSCIIDATCIGSGTLNVVADYRKAVAHLQFIDAGDEFICTGALLADTTHTGTPYLLTANHCFDTQASASTLEAFFDYRTSSCNGNIPNLGTLPRSNGSTLLATGASSDFTFVRLASAPGSRVFLGWNASASAVPNGTRIFRISHPEGFPQIYSSGLVRTSGVPVCSGVPRPSFLYSQLDQSGTFGGSSGGPVILAGGFVVGQLTGGCGANADDGCDYDNSEIDGAFSATFPAISQWLNPTAGPSVCTPNATTLCLAGGRFQVRTTWQTTQGASGSGMAVPLTGDTGYFWFFNPANVEMVIKVLNGCSLNSRHWVFSGGLTDVQVATTVTDTQNGTVKTYTNPLGTKFQPVQDTSAFATCP